RGSDADDSADRDGERAKGRSCPAFDKKDSGSSHQCGDRHAGDRRCGTADDTDDERNNSDEEKAEDDDKESGGKVGESTNLGSGDGLELKEKKHQEDEQKRAAEDDNGRKVVLNAGGLSGSGFAGAALLETLSECADDGRQRAEQRNQSCGSNSACSHRTNVGSPEIGGRHLSN